MEALVSYSIGIIGLILAALALYFRYKDRPKPIDNRLGLVKQWVENARAATKSIVAISYSVGPTSDASDKEKKAWKEYLTILREKCANKEFKARILAPARRERIEALFNRKEAGAEVKVNTRVDKYDFRFQICDDERMILNVPSADTPTSKSESGVELKAKLLVDFCSKTFNTEWSDSRSKDFDKFVEESLLTCIPSESENFTPQPATQVSELTRIPQRVVDHYLNKLVREGRLGIKDGGYYCKNSTKI